MGHRRRTARGVTRSRQIGFGPLRSGLGALVLAVLVAVSPAAAPDAFSPAASEEIRGLWVQRSTLTTPARIDQLVRQATDGGFNTLFLQIRARGDALFAGSAEPRGDAVAPGFDPLARAIDAAHRAGLRVHVWVNVNLVASAATLPTDPTHVIHAHPEWLMTPRELAATLGGLSPRDPRYLAGLAAWTRTRADRVEGLFVSPIPAGAAYYFESLVADLASRYPIDGLHLDYVRYPGPQFDYSAASLDAFRAAIGPSLPATDRDRLEARRARDRFVYVDTYPARWAAWRRARLSDLVARLRLALKARRPDAWLSAAVLPDAGEAVRDRLQDWPDWSRRGLLDAICPMTYTPSLTRYAEQVTEVTRAAAGRPVWAGIGAWRLTSDQIVRHIGAARTAGARGVVLFSYDSLADETSRRDTLRAVGRAAFLPTGAPVASSK